MDAEPSQKEFEELDAKEILTVPELNERYDMNRTYANLPHTGVDFLFLTP